MAASPMGVNADQAAIDRFHTDFTLVRNRKHGTRNTEKGKGRCLVPCSSFVVPGGSPEQSPDQASRDDLYLVAPGIAEDEAAIRKGRDAHRHRLWIELP